MSYSVSVTRSGGGAVVVSRSDSGVKVVEANNVGTLVSVAQAAAASADEDAAAAAASALAASGSASAAAASADEAASTVANLEVTAAGGDTPRPLADHLGDMLSVEDFGAVGDGSADDLAAFAAAGTAIRSTPAVLYVPPGRTFYVSDDVDWTGIRHIHALGTIKVADGKMIKVGGFSTSGIPVDWRFDVIRDVSANQWPTTPMLEMAGVKGGEIHWGYIPRIRIKADQTDVPTNNESNAYFVMFGGVINRVDLYSRGGGWSNDILWIKPRVTKIIEDSDTTPPDWGQWRLIDGIFEGSDVEIDLTYAKDWFFDGVRLENAGSSPGITLAATTFNVKFRVKRTPNTAPYFILALRPDVPWSDAGGCNSIQTEADFERTRINLVSASARSLILSDGGTGCASEIPGMDTSAVKQGAECIEATSSGAVLYLSPLIPIVPEMIASYWSRATIASARPRVYCYDEDKQLITDVTAPGGVNFQSASWTAAEGRYGITSNIADGDVSFDLSGSTRYVRLAVVAGSGGAGAPWYIQEFGWDLYLLHHKPLDGLLASLKQSGKMALAAAPVGVAPAGTVIAKTDGTKDYISIRYVETVLGGAEASGQTTITLASASGISAGDQILIGLDSGATHRSTIASVSAPDVVINDALPSDAAAGRAVKTGRWITSDIGLVVGSNVQAWDADLDAIAALTSAANKVPYSTGALAWALADFSAAGRALVDDADAPAQRTTLGLGAAALLGTGTSGAAVVQFNNPGTLSGGLWIFDGGSATATPIQAKYTDAGAGQGPIVNLFRDSASATAGDALAQITIRGRDAAGNVADYWYVRGEIVDATDTSEDGGLIFGGLAAGSSAHRWRMRDGFYAEGATGGNMGAGTGNFVGVYDDSSLLTCYVLEAERTGAVDVEYWHDQVPNRIVPAVVEKVITKDEIREEVIADDGSMKLQPDGTFSRLVAPAEFEMVEREPEREIVREHTRAKAFAECLKVADLLDPAVYTALWRDSGVLPGMWTPAEWKDAAPSVGALSQRLWELCEIQAVHIGRLTDRVAALEAIRK